MIRLESKELSMDRLWNKAMIRLESKEMSMDKSHLLLLYLNM
jgi:hypothetical protein